MKNVIQIYIALYRISSQKYGVQQKNVAGLGCSPAARDRSGTDVIVM